MKISLSLPGFFAMKMTPRIGTTTPHLLLRVVPTPPSENVPSAVLGSCGL